jgi:hypothetical protein
MKYLISLFIFNLSFCQTKSFDEAYRESNVSKVILETNCENINSLIEKDINSNSIFLFLQSGIAPIRFYTDGKFEEKYDLHYFEQGCIGSNCAENYNFIVFNYLYKTFGKKWMKEIRKDTLGFRKWKKTYKPH